MALIVVDVESDGPIPNLYSMVSFGAVIVENGLKRTYYNETKPISDKWIPEALEVSGFTREQHLKFNDPKDVMIDFGLWIKEEITTGRPTFISDNLAFDWQWINYYFHTYTGSNPFGFSGRRIGDLYCGLTKNMKANQEWKRKYRKTKHDHNPVNDAIGNAEALLEFKKLGLLF